MTLNEINEVIITLQTKLDDIKSVVADINICQSDKSKTILMAAATKLVEPFRQISNSSKS